MTTKDFRGKYSVNQIMATCYFDTKQRYKMVKESEEGEYLVKAVQGHTIKSVDEEALLSPVSD